MGIKCFRDFEYNYPGICDHGCAHRYCNTSLPFVSHYKVHVVDG